MAFHSSFQAVPFLPSLPGPGGHPRGAPTFTSRFVYHSGHRTSFYDLWIQSLPLTKLAVAESRGLVVLLALSSVTCGGSGPRGGLPSFYKEGHVSHIRACLSLARNPSKSPSCLRMKSKLIRLTLKPFVIEPMLISCIIWGSSAAEDRNQMQSKSRKKKKEGERKKERKKGIVDPCV